MAGSETILPYKTNTNLRAGFTFHYSFGQPESQLSISLLRTWLREASQITNYSKGEKQCIMKLDQRTTGLILSVLGILGFAFVADDLDHEGELIGVGTIFLGGLVLLALSFRKK
jgi:hypothetical protein